jgi:hypothetical protein
MDKVKLDYLRTRYLDSRFEHYTCGRLLYLQGSHSAAAVLLAYAIEYHLKAAMIEVKSSWTPDERSIVEKSHDLKILYQACLRRGLLTKSYISPDFMDYAHDHFERRYPKREDNLLTSRGYWRFGGSLLQTYDDCILQLDLALAEHYGTLEHTMGAYAIGGILAARPLTDAFFHENVFALETLSDYKAVVRQNSRLNLDGALLDSPDLLFTRDNLPHPGVTIARAREVLEWDLAAYFRYPKKSEPDPDPARLLAKRSHDLPYGIHYSKWVIERACREFGRGSVDVTEVKERKEVVLWLFDRRAKKWYTSQVLRSGFVESLVRNEESERVVDVWFAKTREQFQHHRRNLRVPPKKRQNKNGIELGRTN